MPGAGDGESPPQAASHTKPRTAPDADFLKPIIAISFLRERKRMCICFLDTPDSEVWMGTPPVPRTGGKQRHRQIGRHATVSARQCGGLCRVCADALRNSCWVVRGVEIAERRAPQLSLLFWGVSVVGEKRTIECADGRRIRAPGIHSQKPAAKVITLINGPQSSPAVALPYPLPDGLRPAVITVIVPERLGSGGSRRQ